jgi:hypothetical protein
MSTVEGLWMKVNCKSQMVNTSYVTATASDLLPLAINAQCSGREL